MRTNWQLLSHTHLGPKIRRGTNILVLGFGCAPGVVQLETLVTVARLAVHAALCCLLLWRLADVAHDGDGCAGSLPVALHDALQGEVSEQHADAAFAQIYVMLAAWARDGGDPGSHRSSAPSRRGDWTWRRATRAEHWNECQEYRVTASGHPFSSLAWGPILLCEEQCPLISNYSQLTAFKRFQHSLKTNRFVLKSKFTNRASACLSLCFISTVTAAQLRHGCIGAIHPAAVRGEKKKKKKVHKERPSRVLEQVKEWRLAGKSASLELIHSLNKKCISFNTYYMKEEYFKCSQWSGQRK